MLSMVKREPLMRSAPENLGLENGQRVSQTSGERLKRAYLLVVLKVLISKNS